MKRLIITCFLLSMFGRSAIAFDLVSSDVLNISKSDVRSENLALQQNQKTIRGKVSDTHGEPIIGANVVVKGTTNGSITDLDGNFIINGIQNGQTLQISYIGYLTQEIKFAGESSLDIILREDSETLEEVVVVGYGTQKKANLTGSVTNVDSKVFETRPVTSAANALQGTMAGVNISPQTGDPNQDLGINVRGTTSVNGGGPLILIDGVESDLKLVNPNDIENISVLKDAAASSIYGVRAAFGVVLITTKKGKADDKLKINYSGNIGWSKATYMPEFTDNSYDHVMFVNQGQTNNNAGFTYPQKQVDAIKNYMENGGKEYYIDNGKYVPIGYRNWRDILISDMSPKQTHNISLSGGSGKTSFYASVGYLNQEGMLAINPDVFQRVNSRLNLENRTYDWMKIGLKMMYNMSEMDQPFNYKDDIWHALVFSSPLRGGQWVGDPEYPQYDIHKGKFIDDQNNEVLLEYGGRTIKRNSELMLSPSIDLNPIKGWNVHVDFSFNKTFYRNTDDKKRLDNLINYNMNSTLGVSVNDSYKITNAERNYYSFNAYTDYEFRLAEKNYFKVMAGYNQELTSYLKNSAEQLGQINPDMPILSIGTGEDYVKNNAYQWALRGGFFRLNYNFDEKYLFEVNGRYDGTSRFPKEDRFVFLPSFSVGWRLTEESFMQFSKPLFDNIKLRASYGSLGNQLLTSDSWGKEADDNNTRYYPYIPIMIGGLSDNYLFGGSKDGIVSPPGLIPASLTWETVSTLNGGIDITMLRSRLDLTFDVYRRTTKNMLAVQELPEILGAKAPPTNVGSLENNGWELTLNWRDRIGKDLTYQLGFTLYDSQAKITEWPGDPLKTGVDQNYKGKKIGEIWGFETDGFFQNEDELANHPTQSSISSSWKVGDIKYKDLNKDGKVDIGANTVGNPGDKKVIGNTTSRYNYAITGGLNYKGIFVNLFFQGVGKRDFWPDQQDFWPLGTQWYNTQKHWISDSWDPNKTDNSGAYFPLTRPRSTQNQQKQTKYLQDASYIRLKNLTIGYNLPGNWITKAKLANARIYFSGENLFETTNVVGPFDPESAGKNGRFDYPFQRVYSFGVDLTF